MGKQSPMKVPFRIFGRETKLFAGAYEFRKRLPVGTVRVSMLEQDPQGSADIHVPTRDFSTPFMGDMETGVEQALSALLRGRTVYVGCGYGIGRTGLFLAALYKAEMLARVKFTRESVADKALAVASIAEVRLRYNRQAVETDQQAEYLSRLPLVSGPSLLATYQLMTRPWTLLFNRQYRVRT